MPDDDEWLDNLETEDDYKDREEYDRSMTPPSPSILSFDEEEILPPPAKKLKARNPFIDDDDRFTPKKRKEKTSDQILQEINCLNLNQLNADKVIDAQLLIINYLKVR